MLSTTKPIIRKSIQLFHRIDKTITRWMRENGITILRLSLGLIYLWFGGLKFFPDLSPAENLAQRTMEQLTFGRVAPEVSIYLLAAWECLIGLGLLSGVWLRVTLLLLWLQMLGTVMPIFFFPETVFVRIPLVPTLIGQYIVKNLVIIGASIVIGATVSGHGPDP